jgi:hypothetical protein
MVAAAAELVTELDGRDAGGVVVWDGVPPQATSERMSGSRFMGAEHTHGSAAMRHAISAPSEMRAMQPLHGQCARAAC